MHNYELPVDSDRVRRSATAWLMLGLISLVLAGLFSVLLVVARTPGVQDLLPFADFFHVALVVHVNLSVLIWLLAVSSVLWSLSSSSDIPWWDNLSLTSAVAGTLVLVIAPFAGAGEPLMSNYVPVLRSNLFFLGLALFAAGIVSHLLKTLFTWRPTGSSLNGTTALRTGIMLSTIVTGAAFLSVLASYSDIPASMGGQLYFEFLFWGGGHVIQFSYTMLMMVCWVVLASSSGCRLELTPRLTLIFFIFLALPIITVPFLYLGHDVTSPGHRLAFTELMKYGGLSSLPLGLAILSSLFGGATPSGEARYLRAALLSSLVLFAVGGVLGFMIAGLDIVIPAHYHGATVGVTIAFMGLTYYLLPRLGFGRPPARLATWQPYLYGGGQLLHILGLAWTGGYGVQRKTAGSAQGVDNFAEIAGMAVMGFGGLISVIGGLLFLVAAYKAIKEVGRA